MILPSDAFLEMTLAFGTSTDFPRNPMRLKYKHEAAAVLKRSILVTSSYPVI